MHYFKIRTCGHIMKFKIQIVSTVLLYNYPFIYTHSGKKTVHCILYHQNYIT